MLRIRIQLLSNNPVTEMFDTISPRSPDQLHIVSYYTKWGKTYWTVHTVATLLSFFSLKRS